MSNECDFEHKRENKKELQKSRFSNMLERPILGAWWD